MKGKYDCGGWNDPSRGTGDGFIATLTDLSKKSHHSEIVKVPWVLWGHSGGGKWCKAMAQKYPEKVLALYLRSAATFEALDTMNDTTFKSLPVVINPGIRERGNQQYGRIWDAAVAMHTAARKPNSITTWAPDPN